jgi:alkanesulfonate monooxygenase SsuD/methylene tetrahydromethanopterin reductase-like flavin-dependent oxidoreductase (luciferase family)
MESSAYGIDLGTLRQRFDRFDEGLTIIRSLLDQRETTFSGAYFQLENAWCEPKPVQAKLPIVIGGKGPTRTLRAAARWADQWDMTFPEAPADWQRLDEVLRGHCATEGRDPAEITRSIHLAFPADVEPAALADRAGPFFEAGVDLVVWSMTGPMDPARLAPLADTLR